MLGPSNLLHHPSLAQVHHVRAEKEALSSAKDGWITREWERCDVTSSFS